MHLIFPRKKLEPLNGPGDSVERIEAMVTAGEITADETDRLEIARLTGVFQ